MEKKESNDHIILEFIMVTNKNKPRASFQSNRIRTWQSGSYLSKPSQMTVMCNTELAKATEEYGGWDHVFQTIDSKTLLDIES